MQIRLTVDGRPVRITVDEDESALEVLRDRLGLRTIKDGCSPQGRCGACTVLWNSRPAMVCNRRGTALDGVEIGTLDGLDAERRAVLARAFAERDGLQCGYCTPGIALRTAWLLDRAPNPDRNRIRAMLSAHLCRCTGYQRIVEAIEQAARLWPGKDLAETPVPHGVGESAPRYDAAGRVLGQTPFVGDLVVDGMLHGAIRLTDHPRARVLSIDTTAARAIPGVQAVLTATDLPAARRVGQIYDDQPVLVGPGEVTHCTASVLAIVAATDRRTARRAAEAIEVRYEVLEPVTSPEDALKPGAPRVHPDRENLLSTTVVRRGDVDRALAASAHVLTETFTTQRIEHAFLEPEAALAIPGPDGSMKVYTEGQGVHDERRQIALVLGVPEAQVTVELIANGGAFGGKEDLSIQHHAALLAARTGRPVRLVLSRDESIRLHPKRHPFRMTYTVGCDADGRLTAVRARIIGDTGGYASVGAQVLERAAGHACGPYRVPAVDVESHAVYTNNPPSGAMRGFGVNQVTFAMEGMLDRLAERVGIDGYDIREQNLLLPGDRFATGQVMDEGLAALETLQAVREIYKSARRDGIACGIACGIKNTGIGNGMADTGRTLIEVEATGALDAPRVVVTTGYTEMGQGLFTVLRQVVCTETGLDPAQVVVRTRSDDLAASGMTTASRATLLAGEATRRAALALAEALETATLSDLVGRRFTGEFICDWTTPPRAYAPDEEPGADDADVTHVTFGTATQVVLLDEKGRLSRVIAVHDVGRAMNPTLCRAQIEGAIHMGLGQALTEDLPTTGGVPDSTRLNDLHLIAARDMPEVEVHLIEKPDPHSAYGIKGVGEIGLVPTAAAVAGALHAFDGTWRVSLPMRGSAAARALLPRRLHEPDHP